MANVLKELGMMFYNAGEKFDEKATEFNEKRKDQYKDFEEKVKTEADSFKKTFDEDVNKVKTGMSDLVENFKFATKKEILDLKDMVDKLSEKLEEMGSTEEPEKKEEE